MDASSNIDHRFRRSLADSISTACLLRIRFCRGDKIGYKKGDKIGYKKGDKNRNINILKLMKSP